MLMIIHGDDIASSRKFYLQQQERFPDALSREGDKVTLTDLAQVFAGGGFFVEEKNIFLEQFITKQKKKSEYKDLIAALENYGREHTIVLWENRELDRGSLMAFPSASVRPFKLPQTLFAFLDNLRPGNGPQLVKLFHQTLETTEVEMIFFMLIRQIRLLLALSEKTDAPIDELKRMQPWQQSKLEPQVMLFGKDKLQELYQQLFAIEKKQKTGNLSAPLIQTIDFLLLTI